MRLDTPRHGIAAHVLTLLLALLAVPAVGDERKSSETASVPEDPSSLSHPLQPVLLLAQAGYEKILDEVQDYTCELVKRERVGNRLLPEEVIFAKVRHKRGEVHPASESSVSIYLRFQSPAHLADREILFVRTGGDDKLLVRNGGKRLAFLTLELPPTCALAMQGNRYPLTEFGIQRLVERMLELGTRELPYGECEVNIEANVAVEEMNCTRIDVCHPVRRDHFMYHLARIYIDDATHLPVRFEAYDWPASNSQEPVLKEEYTYRNLKLNVGLTDSDFDRENPNYKFNGSSSAKQK